MFSGLLALSNALDFKPPMDPVVGGLEMLFGALLSCAACRQRRDFVWLLKMTVFQLAVCLALFGISRLARLAFGAPWSIFSNQALLPLSLTLFGVLGVGLAYRLLRRGDGFHPLY